MIIKFEIDTDKPKSVQEAIMYLESMDNYNMDDDFESDDDPSLIVGEEEDDDTNNEKEFL